jgi:hypothetical protein
VGTFGHGFELGPDDVFGDAAHAGRGVKTAIGTGNHPVRVADNLRDAFEGTLAPPSSRRTAIATTGSS